MEQLLLKATAAIIIFCVAMAAGLIPAFYQKKDSIHKLLINGEFFSRGIFLGAGLIHLLPDALHNLSLALPQIRYPIVMLITAGTIFALQFIEQGLLKIIPSCHNKRSWIAYLLMVLLSIHSIIAGAALGVGNTITGILIIFIAIIAHKGAAAFALAVQMHKGDIQKNIFLKIIALFALMTPLGIAVGSILNMYLHTNSGYLATGIFSAIAAGTFIYIAAFDCPQIAEENHKTEATQILYVGLGILVMAIVAVWL